MSANSVTVQEAVRRGLRTIATPSNYIMIFAIGLPVLLMIIDFSFWWLLLLPATIISAVVYGNWASARWQLWAYKHVNDIHQLQRSAELAGLLSRGSHERLSPMLSMSQREQLRALQERFQGEAVFVDDPSIPGRTEIFHARLAGSDSEPVLALNSAGIWTQNEGFFDWSIIVNERIPQVSYTRKMYGGSRGSGGQRLFRFDTSDGCFEISMSELSITVWELDLLLYIYRGRFGSGQILTNVLIDN